jgi:hypothetical protein
MTFTPLETKKRDELYQALRGNKDKAILMSNKDTSFLGTGEISDEEVITAIREIPCHY